MPLIDLFSKITTKKKTLKVNFTIRKDIFTNLIELYSDFKFIQIKNDILKLICCFLKLTENINTTICEEIINNSINALNMLIALEG